MRIRLNRHAHQVFYILLAMLIALLFVRYALQIDIPRIVLTAIIILIAICGDQDEILAIAMCCIPLHEAIDFYYSIIACTGVYVLKNSKRIRINYIAILILMMIMWEMLHCFAPSFSVTILLITITPLFFLMVVLCTDVSDIDYGFIARIMGVVLVTMCITMIVNVVIKADYNLIAAFSNLRRLGIDSNEDAVVGGAINPNSLGIICVLVITACLQLRLNEQNKKIDTFLILISLVFGTLTASRTFFVCLIAMVIMLLMGQQGDVQKRIHFMIFLVLFTGVAFVLLKSFFPDLMEYYIKRFQVSDITAGRASLMSIYHNFISNNVDVLFWGIGLNNFKETLTETYYVANNVPHNSVQEIIIAWGIPGLIMFVLLFIVIIINSQRYCSRHVLLNYIPLFIILAKSMAGQLVTSSYTMLALSFAYLSLCQEFGQMKAEGG